MARKTKFGDDVRKRAIALREKGFTLSDIRDVLARELGDAPEIATVQRMTAGVSTTAGVRASDLVDVVAEQEVTGAVDVDTEMLRTQARELVTLRQELKDNASAVSQLSRALLATMALIDKRTPPASPPEEEDPDWIAAAESCRMKLREGLAKRIEALHAKRL